MKREKPRLNCAEVKALVDLDKGRSPSLSGRVSLFQKGLVCYAEGWKLSRDGKRLARHLGGEQ